MGDKEPSPAYISPKEEEVDSEGHHVPGLVFEDLFVDASFFLVTEGILGQLLA